MEKFAAVYEMKSSDGKKNERLSDALNEYVKRFNFYDEEIYVQEIPNEKAYEWMKENVPYLELPDRTLEEIYYFRWWVYRKHVKNTEKGYVITEFLSDVPWSGPYNTINCASGFHIREGRWLVHGNWYLEDYIRFWLKNEGDTRSYSGWLGYSIWEYCENRGDYTLALENLDLICANYEAWEKSHKRPEGFFWSIDDRDCMEFSISGSGFRPTLNSYMYADACAIAFFAEMAGKDELAVIYRDKAAALKKMIQDYLWDDDFFKVIPEGDFDRFREMQAEGKIGFPKVDKEHNVREMLGYIPWYFNLPDPGYECAFLQLLDERGFKADYGLTTAERRHPRIDYEVDHECLWNGPVWPYATTQTLVALSNLLRNYQQPYVTSEDYYKLLLQYAQSQYFDREDGHRVPFIDENMNPYTGEWHARKILKETGWRAEKGGYERGKDYNHSMFCDLILSGLLGIEADDNGHLTVQPLIPEDWEYFLVDNLYFGGKIYRIFYDKTGEKYGEGCGLHIQCLME